MEDGSICSKEMELAREGCWLVLYGTIPIEMELMPNESEMKLVFTVISLGRSSVWLI